MTKPDDIANRIRREEENLARLEAEVARTRSRLAALRSELENDTPSGPSLTRAPTAHPDSAATMTSAQKVTLFRSLFRGRADVFPRRWESAKTGRSGYSPACANEWHAELCEKVRKKSRGKKPAGSRCSDCPNRVFVPVSDAEVLKHLQGRQVMGVYPLLQDETCWFLAADFDKESWQEDVLAFTETCRLHGVPAHLERSRSGNGAHAWFFFADPVPASIARRMGCYLITETMARRHQLSMASYDRLFPNQDTMPKGGFGNLIALPLQLAARKHGNTEFVDGGLAPLPDQWVFLSGLERIVPTEVQRLASEASSQGRVIGVRTVDPDADHDEAELPWERPPSGRRLPRSITGPLPARVRAVLAQRLFVDKADLPSPLLDQIKRLAAFQNPEFYKKQSLRLSTALTPRVISCAEELSEHIALPRGCLAELKSLLEEHGVELEVEDLREEGEPLNLEFQGTLTPVQVLAVKALLAHDTGVFVAPPGVGKTVVGTHLVAARGRSTLILVHRQQLLEQWKAQLSLFLGIEQKAIGQIGAGKKKPNGLLDVAIFQSLVRKAEVDDLVAGYGHVIVDECHHVPARSFEHVLSEIRARYVIGLTATPQRRDGHHPISTMQLGPVRFKVDPKGQMARRPFDHKLVVRETGFSLNPNQRDLGIQALYAVLAEDARRNDMIFDDVVSALEEGRSPILLTERRDHLEHFAERLGRFTRNLVVLFGGRQAKARREALERLAAIPDDEESLVLATGRYAGEGFDRARLDTLFLALPVSWKGTLVQYAGRLHRLHPGKTEVRIYDYVDSEVPMLRKMFERRLRGYRAIGYAREEAPLGFGPKVEEEEPVVVELDPGSGGEWE